MLVLIATNGGIMIRFQQGFAFLFGLEMILKMIALTPRCYFKHKWNILDFVVTIIGLVDAILTIAKVPAAIVNVLKTFRVVRCILYIS